MNTVNFTIMNETPNKNITLDDLAGMVKGGFDEVNGRLDKLETRFTTLERGQEDIILKLDNVAYRFELVALEKRVKELEEKVGIKSAKAAA